jgi:uncharacterized membrane protein (DUF106 family)
MEQLMDILNQPFFWILIVAAIIGIIRGCYLYSNASPEERKKMHKRWEMHIAYQQRNRERKRWQDDYQRKHEQWSRDQHDSFMKHRW